MAALLDKFRRRRYRARARTGPEFHKLVTISAQHVPPQWAGIGIVPVAEGGSFDLTEADGVVAHGDDYGWFMWVPDDPQNWSDQGLDPTPPEIIAVQKWARGYGCDWVRFDNDGPLVDELPHWEW